MVSDRLIKIKPNETLLKDPQRKRKKRKKKPWTRTESLKAMDS